MNFDRLRIARQPKLIIKTAQPNRSVLPPPSRCFFLPTSVIWMHGKLPAGDFPSPHIVMRGVVRAWNGIGMEPCGLWVAWIWEKDEVALCCPMSSYHHLLTPTVQYITSFDAYGAEDGFACGST